MLSCAELQPSLLGQGWVWDEDDDVLFLRLPLGEEQELRVEADAVTGAVTMGWTNFDLLIEVDRRDAENRRVHYACPLTLRLSDADALALLTLPAVRAAEPYRFVIDRLDHQPCDHRFLDPKEV